MIAGRNQGKLFTATIITLEPVNYPNCVSAFNKIRV